MNEELINEENICKLDEEVKSKLKGYVCSIKASDSLREKITKKIIETSEEKIDSKVEKKTKTKKIVPLYRRPALIAASLIFLLGLGVFLPIPFTRLPSLAQLHCNEELQFSSNNINELSSKLGLMIAPKDLIALERANFKVIGASTKKVKSKELKYIVLKNDKGERISICFLPVDYKVCKCHKIEVIDIPEQVAWTIYRNSGEVGKFIMQLEDKRTVFEANRNGVPFDCGADKGCTFAYWNTGEQKIAIVTDDLSDLKMIDLIMPLRKA